MGATKTNDISAIRAESGAPIRTMIRRGTEVALALTVASLIAISTGCSGSSSGTKSGTSKGGQRIEISAANVFYNYSGPEKDPTTKAACNQPSSMRVQSYHQDVKSDDTITWVLEIGTGKGCNLTITGIWTETPEFQIVSTTPALPLTIPKGDSRVQFSTKLKLADTSKGFQGPLSMKVDDK